MRRNVYGAYFGVVLALQVSAVDAQTSLSTGCEYLNNLPDPIGPTAAVLGGIPRPLNAGEVLSGSLVAVDTGSPSTISIDINTATVSTAATPGPVTYTVPSTASVEVGFLLDSGRGTFSLSCSAPQAAATPVPAVPPLGLVFTSIALMFFAGWKIKLRATK